jgi:hypothetical protein
MGWLIMVVVALVVLAIVLHLSDRSRRQPSRRSLRALQEKWSGSQRRSGRSTGYAERPNQQRQARSGNGYMTTLQGRVVSLKPDSHNPQTGVHELFVISVAGRTVLVANNVEVGTRVSPAIGYPIEVRGDYLPASGLHFDDFIHNTHRASSGREHGWIRYQGRIYD